jgi:hypothetical protein
MISTEFSLAMRFVLTNVIFWCVISAVYPQSLTQSSIGALVGMRGVILGFHVETQREPVALVRVGRIYKDYERKGFFRIGVLPVLAMDDVSVEIRDPALVTTGLAQFQAWLGSHSKHNVELRRLRVRVGSFPTNRLESGRALITRDGEWELVDGVAFFSGTNRTSVARATLELTGERPGRLILSTTPALITNLFFFSPPIQSVPELKDHS